MSRSIHFENVEFTPVDCTASKWDGKKHIRLKKPKIKKKSKIIINDCYDLFDFVKQVNHHVDQIDGMDDYIEVSFKLKAYY